MDATVQRYTNPAVRSLSAPQEIAPARVTSKDLLGKCSELIIEHNGREYRLRFTQNGKLILTA